MTGCPDFLSARSARWLVLAAGICWAAALRAQELPLTSLADVRTMPRDALVQHPVVRVRGVGTSRWSRTQWRNFCIQDESAGIWVSVDGAHQQQIWQGDPEVLAAVRERVELEGVVQSCLPYGKAWRLRVNTGLGIFLTRVPPDYCLSTAALEDAEVRLQGVATSVFNARGKFIHPRLFVSVAKDVVILKPAPADPFSVPKVPLAALAGFSPEGRSLHRRMIEGIVTYFAPGSLLCLQDGDCAVRIETTSTEPLRSGDRVEASGFTDKDEPVAGLSGTLLRKLGDAVAPPPRPMARRPSRFSASSSRISLYSTCPYPASPGSKHYAKSARSFRPPACSCSVPRMRRKTSSRRSKREPPAT